MKESELLRRGGHLTRGRELCYVCQAGATSDSAELCSTLTDSFTSECVKILGQLKQSLS